MIRKYCDICGIEKTEGGDAFIEKDADLHFKIYDQVTGDKCYFKIVDSGPIIRDDYCAICLRDTLVELINNGTIEP